jgi:hypothetical protein
MGAIQIQKLKSSGVQPFADDVSESLQYFVAQVMILFALISKTFTVESQRVCLFQGSRAKLPAIRGQQPRPTQHLACAQRLQRGEATRRDDQFNGNQSFAYKIKLVRFVSLPKNDLTFVEANILCTSSDEPQVLLSHPVKKRMLAY